MSEARKRAVERLAAEVVETIDFSRPTPVMAVWLDGLLREAGFVAVDPALRERLERTREKDRGMVYENNFDQGQVTDYGDACDDLTESVLAQLRGAR